MIKQHMTIKYFVSNFVHKKSKSKLLTKCYQVCNEFVRLIELENRVTWWSFIDPYPLLYLSRHTYKTWVYLLNQLRKCPHFNRDMNFINDMKLYYITQRQWLYMIKQHSYTYIRCINKYPALLHDYKTCKLIDQETWTWVYLSCNDWKLTGKEPVLKLIYKLLDWSNLIKRTCSINRGFLQNWAYYINWKPLVRKDSKFLKDRTNDDIYRAWIHVDYKQFKEDRNRLRRQFKGSLRQKNRYAREQMDKRIQCV